jgi:hypothetical protein
MNINLHSPLEMKRLIFIFSTYISSGEWKFIFIFTTSFQAVNGGLYSSLSLHFKQGMEVYIVFTTSFQVVNGSGKDDINLHSLLEMKW